MTHIPLSVRSEVIQRARNSCEYCLVHADYSTFTHEIDHVIPRQHGSGDSTTNLAYACAQCNRFKGSNLASIDPETGDIVPIFNPRTQLWSVNFRLDGVTIEPGLPVGRATISLLKFNQVDRLLLRQELLALGRYPFQWETNRPAS